MVVSEVSLSASSPLVNVVETDVATESAFPHDFESAFRENWQNLIDYRLIEWGRSPSQFEDEGVEPPTAQSIGLAIKLAQYFKDRGMHPPDSVVPDPNGGIIFERREKGVREVIHVWEDGTPEYFRFDGTRLAERRFF